MGVGTFESEIPSIASKVRIPMYFDFPIVSKRSEVFRVRKFIRIIYNFFNRHVLLTL